MRPGRAPRGFTLVEVLVALVIVAFGMGALMATLTSAADSAGALRDRSFAQWIALNRLAEQRLSATPPGNGRTEGTADFAGGRWRWRQEVTDPRIAGLRRIDVSVWRDGADMRDSALAVITGFLGTSLAQGNGIDPDFSLDALRGGADGAGGNAAQREEPSTPGGEGEDPAAGVQIDVPEMGGDP